MSVTTATQPVYPRAGHLRPRYVCGGSASASRLETWLSLAGLNRQWTTVLEKGGASSRWTTALALAGVLDCNPRDIFPPKNDYGPEPNRAVAKEAEDGRQPTD